jgi:putative phage-type endonuclease
VTVSEVRQHTDEWYALRQASVGGSDIPVLLGLSPYRSEASLAREKAGEPTAEPDEKQARLFRLGLALEPVIRDEDALKHGTKIRRVNRTHVHPEYPWAIASLDFERVGERTIVEAKASRSGRWDGELPQDVEAQVRWQMGVAGYPLAHVACLRSGSDLVCYDVEHDAETFDGLVSIAQDFRRRLAEGGPFAENAASIKARYPADDGSTLEADHDLAEAVRALVALRERRKALDADDERLETAVKSQMGAATVLVGPDFRVTWKRTKDVAQVDWRVVAEGLLRMVPETDRDAVVGLATVVRPGFRPFRIGASQENS